MKYKFNKKIIRIGNCLGFIIDKVIAEKHNFHLGDFVIGEMKKDLSNKKAKDILFVNLAGEKMKEADKKKMTIILNENKENRK